MSIAVKVCVRASFLVPSCYVWGNLAWDDRLLDSGCSHVSICMGFDSRAACSCNCTTDWFLASLPVGSCFLHLLGAYLCAWGSLGCRVSVSRSLSSWIPF